jgi:mRNA interferase RelE/StbE
MKYTLKLHRDVEKQLSRIPEKQRARLIETMRALRNNPRPSGCLKLSDVLYRTREGQYRIIYAIFDEEVVVFICKVARRTETTYRDLQKLLDRAIKEIEK